jgi:hypothetical protein
LEGFLPYSFPASTRYILGAIHATFGPHGETNEVRGGVPARGPVEVNRGPLMTSGLVRLIGPLYGVPTGPPSHLPRIRFPHRRYRIIFIEGPKSGGRNLKGLRPEPIAQALHSPTERRAQTFSLISGLPSPLSAHDVPSLFEWFIGTIPLCDSSGTYMRALWLLPSPADLAPGLTAGVPEVGSRA